MTSDNDLILRAQGGDMAAFEELVFRHDRQVLSIAARYVLTADDAKDIYQETFLRVHRALKSFRFESDFSTWLFRITVNVCISHRRRARKEPHLPLGEVGGENAGLGQELAAPDNDPGPDQLAVASDIAEHVRTALDALSPRQRTVFTLRHFEQLSLKEIAGAMGCSEGTVKRYLFMATSRLRQQLQYVVE
jgi:RNA polymerase sigma-70 factor (ECF subfamily)